MTQFEIYQCTASKNGGFVNVIQATKSEENGTIATEIGDLAVKVRPTFMVKTPSEQTKGKVFNLDLALFAKQDQSYTKDGEARTSTWLHPRG